MICLFCKRALHKRRYSTKETCNLIDPTDRSHPMCHVTAIARVFPQPFQWEICENSRIPHTKMAVRLWYSTHYFFCYVKRNALFFKVRLCLFILRPDRTENRIRKVTLKSRNKVTLSEFKVSGEISHWNGCTDSEKSLCDFKVSKKNLSLKRLCRIRKVNSQSRKAELDKWQQSLEIKWL